MDTESKKLEIRRRLYKSKRDSGLPIDESLQAFFTECIPCRGRGQICTEYLENGNPIAVLDTCPFCEGDGFILSQNLVSKNLE